MHISGCTDFGSDLMMLFNHRQIYKWILHILQSFARGILNWVCMFVLFCEAYRRCCIWARYMRGVPIICPGTAARMIQW